MSFASSGRLTGSSAPLTAAASPTSAATTPTCTWCSRPPTTPEAELGRRAALGGLSAKGVGEHFDPVGDTADDVRGSVNYSPQNAGLWRGGSLADPDLDIKAAGSFAELWAQHQTDGAQKAGATRPKPVRSLRRRASSWTTRSAQDAATSRRRARGGLLLAGLQAPSALPTREESARDASTYGSARVSTIVKQPKPVPEPTETHATQPAEVQAETVKHDETQAPMGQASRGALATPTAKPTR